jgi:putative oxidoreductase
MRNARWKIREHHVERKPSDSPSPWTRVERVARWLIHPPDTAPPETILLRLMAGGVFLWEGTMKFIFPSLGVKRFALIGFPVPHLLSNLVGSLEVLGGLLLMAGLFTRLTCIPFVIEMIVAIVSTKIPLFLGTSPLPHAPVPPQFGFWAVLHDGRSDFAQILTVLFLLVAGPGKWSLDALRAAGRSRPAEATRRALPGAQPLKARDVPAR